MDFNRKELLAKLEAVRPALGTTIPMFGYFWFDGKAVSAFDGGLGIRLECPTDFSAGLPKALHGVLSTGKTENVSIEVKGAAATIKMGRSKTELATLPSGDSPWKFPKDAGKATMPLSEEVCAALSHIGFVRISKGMHAFHHGAVMYPQKDLVEFYATDSKSLAWAFAPLAVKTSKIILPWVFVDRVQSLISPGEGKLSVLDDCLLASAPGILIASNRQDFPETPNLPALLNKHVSDDEGMPLPEELEAALKRAIILADGEEAMVTISLDKSGLMVKGAWPLGRVDEAISVKVPKKQPACSGDYRAAVLLRGLGRASNFFMSDLSIVLQSEDEDLIYVVAMTGK